MAPLLKLPPEVLRQIALLAHDGLEKHRFAADAPPLGRYELRGVSLRRNLSSLRQVNRLFNEVATPILFQHITVCCSGGTQRFQQLSKSVPLRQLVRRMEICINVKPPGDLLGYRQELEKKKEEILRYLSRLAVVIHTALPKFSNVRVVRLDLEDIRYNLNLDTESYNRQCCWKADTANLFESFATVLCRTQFDKLDELDLSFPLAYDFGCFLDADDTEPSSKALFQKLKYLKVKYGRTTAEGEGIEFRYFTPNQVFDRYIGLLLHLAPNVHSLAVEGSDVLALGKTSFPPLRLQSLDLGSLSVTGDALISLIQQSPVLKQVSFIGVYLESGRWKDALLHLAQSSITSFYLETCGYQLESESAQFRSPGWANCPDAHYIETTETEDLDACEAVFERVRENKRRKYGSAYNEAADVEHKEVQKRLIKLKTEALLEFVRSHFAVQNAIDIDEDWQEGFREWAERVVDSESDDSDFE